MKTEKLYNIQQVLNLIPVSKTTIYDMIKKGKFPKPLKMGKKISWWKENDIKDWFTSKGIEVKKED